jgi:ACS family tartrate transporter-like MFS transporter
VRDPLTAFLLLVIATVGIYCFFGPFWTIPGMFLAEAAAAVGFAIINSIGNVGGFIGPSLLGLVTQATGSVSMGLVAIGGCLILCGILAAGTGRYRAEGPAR